MAKTRKRVEADGGLVIGWVEWAALPDLGVPRVKAKIDTGARTSALHVLGILKVGEVPPHTVGGPPRPLVELKIPSLTRVRKPSYVTARAVIQEFVTIRDSGGHPENRPVIETTLAVGPLLARVRISLTDRGDMMYPMLIGRTALGARLLVDPHQRYRLTERKRPRR